MCFHLQTIFLITIFQNSQVKVLLSHKSPLSQPVHGKSSLTVHNNLHLGSVSRILLQTSLKLCETGSVFLWLRLKRCVHVSWSNSVLQTSKKTPPASHSARTSTYNWGKHKALTEGSLKSPYKIKRHIFKIVRCFRCC